MLIEGEVDYAIYMLDPSGIITNWNAGATHIKDYTAGKVIGRHFSCLYTRFVCRHSCWSAARPAASLAAAGIPSPALPCSPSPPSDPACLRT